MNKSMYKVMKEQSGKKYKEGLDSTSSPQCFVSVFICPAEQRLCHLLPAAAAAPPLSAPLSSGGAADMLTGSPPCPCSQTVRHNGCGQQRHTSSALFFPPRAKE